MILSIISFICGVIVIILSIKGINHSLGQKSLFSLNIIASAFGLLILSIPVYSPKIHIVF